MNKIILWKNVKFWGKVESRFVFFELIFDSFIIVVKKPENNCFKIYISSKNNEFFEKFRKGEVKCVDKFLTFHLPEGQITIINSLKVLNHIYKVNFTYFFNKRIFELKHVFIILNTLMFFLDNNIIILQFDDQLIKMKDNDFIQIFEKIIKQNDFNFFMDKDSLFKNIFIR